jgi:hypothetical protein
VHDARLDLVSMRAALGRHDRAAEALATTLAELVASFDAEDRAARAHLDAVRRGGPLFPMDEAWLTPDGTRAADEALAAWRSATDRRRARAQRECAKVLRAVAALARSGQLDRARELFARLELADDRRSGVDGPLVAAWVAMGELDRAVAHAAETPWLALEAVTPLVVGLSAAGRRSEALAILGPALERVDDRAGLRELAPAVLALADDPREQAEAMLASWTRADVERSRLEC